MKQLLLVEDDNIFAEVLGRALEKRGLTVHCCPSVEAARQTIAKHTLDGAVLDLNLDGDSSLPLIEPLRQANPDIRIVVLTGYASIATAVEAVRRGACEYLTKPANADTIVQALQTSPSPQAVPLPEKPMSVRRLEWEHLQRVLMECDGNISETARRLGMHRRTLQRKLAKKPARH